MNMRDKDTDADLKHCFSHHNPPNDATKKLHDQVRAGCFVLAKGLNDALPASSELDQALNKLEEVMFWANAAVARHPAEEAKKV